MAKTQEFSWFSIWTNFNAHVFLKRASRNGLPETGNRKIGEQEQINRSVMRCLRNGMEFALKILIRRILMICLRMAQGC